MENFGKTKCHQHQQKQQWTTQFCLQSTTQPRSHKLFTAISCLHTFSLCKPMSFVIFLHNSKILFKSHSFSAVYGFVLCLSCHLFRIRFLHVPANWNDKSLCHICISRHPERHDIFIGIGAGLELECVLAERAVWRCWLFELAVRNQSNRFKMAGSIISFISISTSKQLDKSMTELSTHYNKQIDFTSRPFSLSECVRDLLLGRAASSDKTCWLRPAMSKGTRASEFNDICILVFCTISIPKREFMLLSARICSV